MKLNKRTHSVIHKRTLSPIKLGITHKEREKSQKNIKYSPIPNSSKTLKISKKDVKVLKEAVEELWTKKEFPETHKEAFRRLLENKKNFKVSEMIVNEMENIENNTEPYQLLKKDVECRIGILEKLFKLTVKEDAIPLLQELRIETYKILKKIKDWRSALSDHRLQFLYQNINYIMTIRSDYFKLINSEVGKWFNFEKEKVDALFLSPKIVKINSDFLKYYKN